MSNLFQITPDQIRTGWEKYGDGTPLKEGFPEWLAAQINDDLKGPTPPELLHDCQRFFRRDHLFVGTW